MDAFFHSLMQDAWRGRLEEFERRLEEQPELVTRRSSCGHPTLLQFVVLDGGTGKIPDALSFATTLIERGAALDEPLVAAASVGSLEMAELLLAAGAPAEACAPWTPLEEAVYWAHRDLPVVLRSRGAVVRSLRCAAGLGDGDAVRGFLTSGGPAPDGGPVRFPWGHVSDDPGDVVNQALVIAAKNGAAEAAALLLAAGADPRAFPPGVHEGGSPLHLAAMYGREEVVDLLLAAGADPTRRDPEHHSDPAGWARYGGFDGLAARLDGLAAGSPEDG